jgi:hypothetical protein
MLHTTDMPQRDKAICLLFGVAQLGLTAYAWAALTPYLGPTLEELSPEERARVWTFLAFGPLSALPAATAMLWHRRLGAAWLVVGGAVSGLMAVAWFFQDRGALLAPLTSAPMAGVGAWQLLSRAGPGVGDARTPAARAGSLLLGIVLFFVGWVGTYALLLVLVLNNVTGLRGGLHRHGGVENGDLADTIVLLLVGAAVASLTLARAWLKLRWEFLAGQWAAVFLGVLVICAR